MSFQRVSFLAALLVVASGVIACKKSDSGSSATPTSTATAPAAPPEPAATPAAPAASAAAPATPPAPKEPDVMTSEQAVAKFKADKASMMGQKVKIKGFYMSHTVQADQINVDISPKPDIGTSGPLCVFPIASKADLAKLHQKSEITVSGTVEGEFFDRPKLTGCKLE